ncbi:MULTISPECIES: hypothetical protein [unclassified Lysinibacillus]|uniref:hypothetical protein n=1 Tax=unclassified Lysinibacillus TaxID=2636778 RepID=UPI00232E8668|nr:hypothetical protein [Lysinibacillus sp. OF-1]WCH49646.1 hypothetical protein NV349_09785 [Lysinibacillus sp. OF-1]
MVLLQYAMGEKDLPIIKEVYQSVGWKKHDEQIIKQVFNVSTYQVFTMVDGKTVGLARWSILCRHLQCGCT